MVSEIWWPMISPNGIASPASARARTISWIHSSGVLGSGRRPLKSAASGLTAFSQSIVRLWLDAVLRRAGAFPDFPLGTGFSTPLFATFFVFGSLFDGFFADGLPSLSAGSFRLPVRDFFERRFVWDFADFRGGVFAMGHSTRNKFFKK